MPSVKDMENIVDNVLSSYGARVQSIADTFDTTSQLLEGFQGFFLDTKQEREKVSAELRENLAKNEHLRKKDFDNMMQDILSTQDEREKEVRNLLKNYLNEQKEMVQVLREDLEKFKNSLAKDEVQRVREFQVLIKNIFTKQDERKNEVTSKLKNFQKEQQEMAKILKGLLAKRRELRIKDFKSMLKEFRFQHKKRISHQEERKQEVRSMLEGFKKERMDSRFHGNPKRRVKWE